MQAGKKRRWKTRPRPIDADNVLLIVNSDAALSGTIADYYQAARNLADHRLTFALGTGSVCSITGSAFYTSVIVPVYNYIKANGITAVLCSAAVPPYVESAGPIPRNYTTSAVLGSAAWYVEDRGGMMGNSLALPSSPDSSNAPGLHQSLYISSPSPYHLDRETWPPNDYDVVTLDETYRFFEESYHLPYGRIGLANVSGAPVETEAETKRMINDAIANELTFQDTTEKGYPVHIGFHDRVPPWITAIDFEKARRRLVAHGVNVQQYSRSYAAGWPLQPPPPDYDLATMLAGGLSLDAWALVGAAIMNEAVGAPYISSYNLKPGAWGYEATSAGRNLYINIITNGGCAGIGAQYEPYSDGVIKADLLMMYLMQGATLAQANALSYRRVGWAMEVTGDPLYRPFGRQTQYHH